MSQSSPTPDPVAWMVRSGAGHSIGQPELVEALARGNAERYSRLAGWRDKPYTVVPLYDHPSALPATTPSDTSVCQRPEDCTYASEGWCPRCEPCRRISPSEGSAPDTAPRTYQGAWRWNEDKTAKLMSAEEWLEAEARVDEMLDSGKDRGGVLRAIAEEMRQIRARLTAQAVSPIAPDTSLIAWPDGQLRAEAPYRCGTFVTGTGEQCVLLSHHDGPCRFPPSAFFGNTPQLQPQEDTMMQAKLTVTSVNPAGAATTSQRVIFSAVTGDKPYGPDGENEDNTFARYTPAATLDMSITNPILVGRFQVGDTFYVHFSKVDT